MIKPLSSKDTTEFKPACPSGMQAYNSLVEIEKESFIQKKIKDSEETKLQLDEIVSKFGALSFIVLFVLGAITRVQELLILGLVFSGVVVLILLLNNLSDNTKTFKSGLLGEQILRNKLLFFFQGQQVR